MKDTIEIKGAHEHNLKNVDLSIPRDKLVVFTGVSGSGKSSLAFDTLYAEGQRRYVESLSAYARQFLGLMEKPKVDYIEGLSPAISIDQKAASKNPRSTVGTVTEIYDYLRILFARIGKQYCYQCGELVGSQSIDQMISKILSNEAGTKIQILAPLVVNRKGEHKEELDQARKGGFARVIINGQLRDLSEEIVLDKKSKHNIDIVVDRIVLKEAAKTRLTESLETALKLTEGIVKIEFTETSHIEIMSEKNSCAKCGISYPDLTPQHFSFNSPIGMCPVCNGLGNKLEFDQDMIIPDTSLSLMQGAVLPWGKIEDKKNGWLHHILKQLEKEYNFSLTTPWRELPERIQSLLLKGTGSKRYRVQWESPNGLGHFMTKFDGIIPTLERRMRETSSEEMKQWYLQYITDKPCPECKGKKLKKEVLAVRIEKEDVASVTHMTIEEAISFFKSLNLSGNDLIIATDVLKEIQNRLSFLMNVGLHYLNLDRRSPTLSGGESQRIRLASQIGSGLVGVMYILDEPSIGLHQRDNDKLINMLCHLRDLGNTIIVVEHDEDMMKKADMIVDFGPKAGIYGGEIVSRGTIKEICADEKSLTGQYLSGKLKIEIPTKRVMPDERMIHIIGATQNNLKDVDVKIPIGLLTCVTGVSGSGKSSLINQILYPAMCNKLNHSNLRVGSYREITGYEYLDKVIDIDQQPIGRTPRSNPATYIKLFDLMRNLFAEIPAAKVRGYKAGRFSFNIKGGRCEACEGAGLKLIEMHFLPDVYVTCEVCNGKRYNQETLAIKYKDKDIADVLNMDIQEAMGYFENIPTIANKIRTMIEVGLDYIKLGQSATTLSGGEAQRIKLAKELSKTSTGKTLYILDEPTTGLHFDDIKKLLVVLQRLVAMGNTVVVIEHNMDVIKTADYIIDLGPEGGSGGGTIVATGTPEEIVKNKKSYTGKYLKEYLKK